MVDWIQLKSGVVIVRFILALMESIALLQMENDDKKGRDAIPSILSDALAVSFDNQYRT